MWLYTAENNRFGVRHLQVDPQIRWRFSFAFTAAQHNDTAVRDMAPDASRCPDDVRSLRAANKYRHASHEARYVVIYACSNLINSLCDIPIFLGLVSKESPCSIINFHGALKMFLCYFVFFYNSGYVRYIYIKTLFDVTSVASHFLSARLIYNTTTYSWGSAC